MQIIHLANTDFEFELAHPHPSMSIQEAWERSPICLQLQYLPLLYASADEAIAVTQVPDSAFLEQISRAEWRKGEPLPSFILLSQTETASDSQCLSWGASLRVKQWTQARGVQYAMPDWKIVQEVNSKQFSFTQAPSLPGSALIWNSQDLTHWIKETEGKRVLKTCFGLSGRGHYFIEDDKTLSAIQTFCQKEWIHGRPLIGEPWVERVFDFSTQWEISPQGKIQLLGSTVFEVDPQGVYQATLAGPESQIFGEYFPFLERHKKVVQELLSLAAKQGFFGYAGVDAFLYRCPTKEICLHPVVEINGRQTMSSVALRFQRHWFQNQSLRFSFTKTLVHHSILPSSVIGKEEKPVYFNRHLTFELC